MRFYLLRHGQTDWNTEGRLQGRKNMPMNGNGVRQITELAEQLQKMNFQVNLIVSSPLDRAKQSAEIVAHGAILAATKQALSQGELGYYDSTVPIIQGNMLCCEIRQNEKSIFYNLF